MTDKIQTIKVYCDCGNPKAIEVKKGAKAFYCDKCGASKLINEEKPSFHYPNSDMGR